jgi:mRNA interferase RelE/StbE
MVYTINFSRHALKGLEAISEPYYTTIKNAILDLTQNPRPHGYKKLKGINAYRIRVANYRIIYDIIDEILVIELIDIGHRKDIYK